MGHFYARTFSIEDWLYGAFLFTYIYAGTKLYFEKIKSEL